jgi:hypothetical protein
MALPSKDIVPYHLHFNSATLIELQTLQDSTSLARQLLVSVDRWQQGP